MHNRVLRRYGVTEVTDSGMSVREYIVAYMETVFIKNVSSYLVYL